MSSTIENKNIRNIFYSPEKSPKSSPLAASSLPGLIKTPSPVKNTPRRFKGQHRFNPTGSPSAATQVALQELSLGSSQQVSPETQKAHDRLHAISSRQQTHLRRMSKKMNAALISAAEKYQESAENGWIAALDRCPLLHPERADTDIYPENSEELAKKAKAIAKIKKAEATGLTCLPTGLPFLVLTPDLPLPETALTAHEAYVESVAAVGLYADSRARETQETRDDPQQDHLEAWMASNPESP